MTRAARGLLPLATALLFLGCSGSLDDLTARHATKEAAPPGVETAPKVVFNSPRHHGAYTFGHGVRQAFTDKGVFLECGLPMFKERLWIPLAAIAGCSRTQWSHRRWDTNLWVEDAQVLISFPDNGDRLANWCSARGITMFDHETEAKWLQLR